MPTPAVSCPVAWFWKRNCSSEIPSWPSSLESEAVAGEPPQLGTGCAMSPWRRRMLTGSLPADSVTLGDTERWALGHLRPLTLSQNTRFYLCPHWHVRVSVYSFLCPCSTYADVDGGEKKGLCELECVDRGCERRLAPGESKQGAGLDSWCRRPASGVTAGRRQTETEITAMGGLVIPRDVKEKNPILHSPVTTYIQAHWPACVLKWRFSLRIEASRRLLLLFCHDKTKCFWFLRAKLKLLWLSFSELKSK